MKAHTIASHIGFKSGEDKRRYWLQHNESKGLWNLFAVIIRDVLSFEIHAFGNHTCCSLLQSRNNEALSGRHTKRS